MANGFWKNLGGAVVNGLVPGKVYNSYTGQWAPTGVLAPRVAAGVAGQFMGPAGTLAGMVTDQYVSNTEQGQAFDMGIEGWKGLLEGSQASVDALTGSLGDGQTSVSRLSPGLIGAGAPMTGAGGFGWQGQQSAPTTPGGFQNGIFNGGEGNFGPNAPGGAFAWDGGAASGMSQAQADYAKYGGAQNQFKGMSGAYASPNNFQGPTTPAIFASRGKLAY